MSSSSGTANLESTYTPCRVSALGNSWTEGHHAFVVGFLYLMHLETGGRGEGREYDKTLESWILSWAFYKFLFHVIPTINWRI